MDINEKYRLTRDWCVQYLKRITCLDVTIASYKAVIVEEFKKLNVK